MELTGEQKIAADRETVFTALNEVDVLRECIPGCESIERLSNNQLKASVRLKIGPLKATFRGLVTISNIIAPSSYTITGEGQGGVAGHAKGSADVVLKEESGVTSLEYNVHAAVGGKIAQVGARLINGTAKSLAGKFFAKFAKVVEARSQPSSEDR